MLLYRDLIEANMARYVNGDYERLQEIVKQLKEFVANTDKQIGDKNGKWRQENNENSTVRRYLYMYSVAIGEDIEWARKLMTRIHYSETPSERQINHEAAYAHIQYMKKNNKTWRTEEGLWYMESDLKSLVDELELPDDESDVATLEIKKSRELISRCEEGLLIYDRMFASGRDVDGILLEQKDTESKDIKLSAVAKSSDSSVGKLKNEVQKRTGKKRKAEKP
ncbi:hypothetical protein P154DRAFT_536573 [Amniculicola lignicola CBS 123094]|uniref:Uncharacterized protein n=1 Tax=Amniculicola lignicola CBS 123094 TaxID=1392246 RepID=A0A6A5WAI1_9PLEO|nr:hypothetical protein P154DRAFT_536573 [Amniculicola lignicola CBS 123094]